MTSVKGRTTMVQPSRSRSTAAFGKGLARRRTPAQTLEGCGLGLQAKSHPAVTPNVLGSGSSRHGLNRRRSIRKDPEPLSVRDGVAHPEEEGRRNVLPWCRLVGAGVPPVGDKEGRPGCVPEQVIGHHVVRGRQPSPVPAPLISAQPGDVPG